MSRVAYVNGSYVAHREAAVHVEDRGYQFADGVYEVCEVFRGQIADERRHLDRLARSLGELKIQLPMGRAAMSIVIHEVVRRNRVHNGLVYIQVTRGVARRDHVFPHPDTPPAFVVTAKSTNPTAAAAKAENGVTAISVPENRWPRVDIKSVSLLPNCLARQQAKEAGSAEAFFVDQQGLVTEGAATNVWIISQDGTLITRPAESGILRGITRTVVLEMAAANNLKVEERAFSIEEAQRAREVFITAASTIVMPIVEIDKVPIGNGKPGSMATELRAKFHDFTELAEI